jgi:chloramphenicol-sensitive protein RarD
VRIGIFYAIGAYLLWGLFPLYFRAVASVPAGELLAQRVVWSFVFVCALVSLRLGWRWLGPVVRDRRVVAIFSLTAVLVFVNWGLYIWSVSAGRIVDASLGYFMTPLVNVLLGAAYLKERLRRAQWISVGCAGLGVLWLTLSAGAPPWIGLALAATFGLYGLLRKTAVLGAFEGLALETAIMLPLALVYLLWLGQQGSDVFRTAGPRMQCLIAASGPVTALPLLFFAAAARRIPLSTLGLIQYLGPSIQLMLAVLLFGEPFPPAKFAGYAAIWAGLLLFSVEGLWHNWLDGRARG